MALTLWSVMTIFAGETAYLFSYFINDSKTVCILPTVMMG